MSPSQSSSGGGGRHKGKDWDVGWWGNGIKTYMGEKKAVKNRRKEMESEGETWRERRLTAGFTLSRLPVTLLVPTPKWPSLVR